jgi:Xaa-Pro aminopeptidase
MRRVAPLILAAGLALAPEALAETDTTASVGPDVKPELPASVYAARRARLMQSLGGCAAALRSFPKSDEEPDPYFYYLTGIEEKGAVLVLSPRSRVVKSEISLPPRNPGDEIWTGYKQPISAKLSRAYQVDRVSVARGSVPRALKDGLRRSRCYSYFRFPGTGDDISSKALGEYLRGYSARTQMRWEELEKMRAIHDEPELQRIRKAIAITYKGQEAAVRTMARGVVERSVSSAIRDAYYAHDATGLAFPSIVGSGPNGAVLHWNRNDRVITGDELVVIDIGASYGHYAADITRTYPVSGSFSPEQKKIYEKVLEVQNLVISKVRPGISMDELNRIAGDALLAEGYEMPHSIGHFVGLEVHDVGDYGGPLEAGMVITVEPGIYLRNRFGVRIEDMVLVTDRGHQLMSGDVPRTPAKLEAWMKKVRAGTK